MFHIISNTITFINESPKRKAVFHVNLINYCTLDSYNFMKLSLDFQKTLNMLQMVRKIYSQILYLKTRLVL